MEFPTVPNVFSFIAAPAIFPPTAPLSPSMIRLIMFTILVLGLSALHCVRASADSTRRVAWVAEKLPSYQLPPAIGMGPSGYNIALMGSVRRLAKRKPL